MRQTLDQESRQPSSAGISRNQNAVYVMPHDWASIGSFLGPLVDRIDEDTPSVQLLVIASDNDVAAAATASAATLSAGRSVTVLAATSVARASRMLRIHPSHVVAGTADVLVELLRGAAIKLDAVKMICIAWADELVAGNSAASQELETLMGELPKDASRTIVAAEATPALDELVERYARRARRVAASTAEGEPLGMDYVTVPAHSRLATLRRLLDNIDPASALVFVRESDTETDVTDLLRALGYRRDGAVRVGRAAAPGTALTVLFDLPASREELREAAAAAARTIALVQPNQLTSLRALASGGALRAISLPDAANRAREREIRLRAELSAALQKGEFGRELLTLEPLLDQYDGIEIAAAALQLLDRARADLTTLKLTPPLAPASAAAAAPAAREAGAMVRLFVSVGSRDNVQPRDLVGAIANTANVSSGDIGKVDVRESHSIVEVAASIADVVIEKVTGTSIRGRRAVFRRDEERPRRDTAPRSGGGKPRPPARGGMRPSPRGPRSRDRE